MSDKIKILILEDSPTDIEFILRQFKKSGLKFISEIVQDEISYKKALNCFIPDIVLSDCTLPKFDCLTAFHIKQTVSPDIPFIIISGTIGEENAVELIKNGVTDYVSKDKLYGLMPKIRRALKETKEYKQRVLAERNLNKSEKRLIEAQHIAKIGNWEMNATGEMIYWSDEVYKILGYTAGSVSPSLEKFHEKVHPDDKQLVNNYFDTVLLPDAPDNLSYRIVSHKDIICHVHLFIKIKTEEDKKSKKIFGVLQDITQLKQTEEKLKEINQEISLFISRTTHDLRGPVASVIGLVDMIKNEIKGTPASSFMKLIDLMNESAVKLDKTIISLFDSIKIREIIPSYEEINFPKVIHAILERVAHYPGYERINFHVNCSSTIRFRSDKEIIYSIFQNLIENSIKYQDLSKDKSFIDIAIQGTNGDIEIIFKDNGVGIAKQIQPYIFNMFYRGNEDSKGTGLGLYLVKCGVAKLRGTISLESELGKGCCFKLHLPNSEFQKTDIVHPIEGVGI